MSTISVTIKSELHDDLKAFGDLLDLRSFSEVIKFLKDNYLYAPAGVPVEVFNMKRDKYIGSYPDEFRQATRMCLGVTVPEEFDAVFEEVMRELIKQTGAVPEETIVLQCSRCNHVWDYQGKKEKLNQIHCPTCGATASKNWLRELRAQPIL